MQQPTQYGAGWGAPRDTGPGGPVAGRGPLAPGARVAGTLICLVLLGVEIAWVVRDIRAIGFHDTLWTWLGLQLPGAEHGLIATSGLDAVLLVVLIGGLAAARRSSAGWAFVTVGVFAVGYRLSGLWIFTADWADGAPLHDRALATCVAFVVGGLALILIAAAGRRPAGPFAPAGPDAPPAPPRTGPAVVGGLLALAIGLELAGWQFYYVQKYDNPEYQPHLYKHLLTGERTLNALLSAPEAYGAWLTVLIALATAAAAFAKSPAARPLGLALGVTMFLNGVVGLDTWHTEKVLFKSKDLPTYILAQQSFEVFELVAGLLLLALLALRGAPRPTTLAPLPPTWAHPTAPPAWGYPPQPPTTPNGTFGPPPNLPPNLPPQPPQFPPGP